MGAGTMPRSRSYKQDLLQALQDPAEAEAYLSAALEDDDPQVFLMAIRDVVEATIGMAKLAEQTNRNRESLYKTLSEKGNPELSGIRSILDNLGYRLAVERVQNAQY
jgi:probable addiction module antidote protein